MNDTLQQIFNALTHISTKGEDTLIMADCLRALQRVIQNDTNKEEE